MLATIWFSSHSSAKHKQLPAIETVLKALNDGTIHRVPPVYVLILCPTRELASQVCAEARVLLKHHNDIGVQTLIGGTRFKVDQRRLESEPCQVSISIGLIYILKHCTNIVPFAINLPFLLYWEYLQILVATPGRLLDHIESKSGISVRLMKLQMLILDEADHLLNLGFRKDIEKIVDCLPRKRQSFLFSATVPKEVLLYSYLNRERNKGLLYSAYLSC